MLVSSRGNAFGNRTSRLPLCQKSTPFRAWLRWALSVQSLRLSGNAADANKGGLTMRIWISVGILIASTVGAYAQTSAVPEIDAFSGMAAMGVVGSIAVLIWERRRPKK